MAPICCLVMTRPSSGPAGQSSNPRSRERTALARSTVNIQDAPRRRPDTFTDIRIRGDGSGSYLLLDFGPSKKVKLSRVELLPRPDRYASRITGTVVEGSDDRENWTTLTPPAVNTEDWQSLPVKGSRSFRYLRVFNPSQWYGNMAELTSSRHRGLGGPMQVARLGTAALGVLCSAAVLGSASAESLPLVTERLESWVKQGSTTAAQSGSPRAIAYCWSRASRSRCGSGDLYRLGRKWLGAATILALVDKGKLSLDDTVEKWLPEFRGDPKGKATLRQLFSHTSGFPPYQRMRSPSIGTRAARSPRHTSCPSLCTMR